MTNKARILLIAAAAFLAGVAGPALVVWNPGHWGWAERLAGHDHTEGLPAGAAVKDTATEAGPETTDAAAGEREILYWRAPMDPSYVSDKPGKSPMGMDLIPVYEDEAGESGAGIGVRVDPGFLQNFAVRTAVAERGSIPIEIRTVGILTHNPDRLYSINTKFTGWIERSYFNNIGQYIKKGDVLFEIYSPELVTTQQEYLAAFNYLSRLEESSAYSDAIDRARSLLQAARERLHYWDITDDQIDQLEQSRQLSRRLKIISPYSGYMVEKMADSLEGMKVAPGMTVYKLADHSKLWAEVELYEYQIQHLHEGQPGRITVDAFPGRVWGGRIVFFEPAVDPQTRTLRAYIEVENRDLRLRPQMYANIQISPPGISGVVKVPEQAVIHSGERAVVVVRKGRGLFEPREVELGPTGDDYQAILSGLRPGEVVVTSSQFLIDSESNLKAAITQLLGEKSQPEGARGPNEKPAAAGHNH